MLGSTPNTAGRASVLHQTPGEWALMGVSQGAQRVLVAAHRAVAGCQRCSARSQHMSCSPPRCAGAAVAPNLVLDSAGTAYLAFQAGSRGVVGWSEGLRTQPTGVRAVQVPTAAASPVPHAAHRTPPCPAVEQDESHGGAATVARFVDGAWQFIGGEAFSTGEIRFPHLAVGPWGDAYIVYQARRGPCCSC